MFYALRAERAGRSPRKKTMLTIENQNLTITHGAAVTTIGLPAVSTDAVVRVWSVPADYRDNGLFVAIVAPGQPEEIPACDPAAAQLLGEVAYPASQALQRSGAQAAAHARIEAWRDAQERAPLVFEHAGHAWDGGLATRQRLQPVVALDALPDGFFWTDANNTDVPVSLAELQALNAAHETAIVLRGFEIHAAQRAMKSALESMGMTDLQAFDPDHWQSEQ